MRRLLSLMIAASLAGAAQADDFEAAKNLFESGLYKSAVPALEKFAKDKAHEIEANLYLARIYSGRGELDKAEEMLKPLVKKAPQNHELQLTWGQVNCGQAQVSSVFSKMGYAKDCVKAFEAAVQIKPDFFDAQTALLQYYTQAPSIVGGGMDKARAQAEKIAKIDAIEGSLAAATLKARELAEKEEDQKKELPKGSVPESTKVVLEALKAAVAARPDNDRYQAMYASAAASADLYDDAYPAAQKALQLNPVKHKNMLQLIGGIAGDSGRWLDEGLVALKSYLEKEPSPRGNAFAHLYLGQIYTHQKNAEAAKAAFAEAAKFKDSKSLTEKLKKAGYTK